MSIRYTLYYYKDKLFYGFGLFFLIIALIGFCGYFFLNHFQVITPNGTHNARDFTLTTGTIEAYRQHYPNAEITHAKKGIPWLLTITLALAIALITRSRRVSNKERRSMYLLNIMSTNGKVKLTDLSNEMGIDKNFVLETLPILNLERGTSFSYHSDSNMIICNDSTVDWHLNTKCDNCGAIADVHVNIHIEHESLTCPYCSSRIHDPDFISFKKTKADIEKTTAYSSFMNFLKK